MIFFGDCNLLLNIIVASHIIYSTCSEPPNSKVLFQNRSKDILWVGEMHGTNEQPKMFSELICAATKTGRPVFVALERGTYEQSAWDKFLASRGGRDSLNALVATWQQAQDGRESSAMAWLAERLRVLKQEKKIIGVKMIVPAWTQPGTQNFAERYEASMAAAVEKMRAAEPNALILVYSGSAHAHRAIRASRHMSYKSAAAHLPQNEVLTVIIKGKPGRAWNCGDATCGVNQYLSPDAASHPRGVVLDGHKDGFDAVAYTGTKTTPSFPAVNPQFNLAGRH